MKKIAVLIDGGHLRVLAGKAGKKYTPNLVEKLALSSRAADEEIYRILYYDCDEYSGTARQPVSGVTITFTPHSTLMTDLARKQLFAVRRGVLKFRGFKPKVIPIAPAALTDADFKPDFEQKGVDMRLGLDIALFCQTRAVDRIVLMTNDTDTVPAMKYARRAGLQVVLVEVDSSHLASELPAHADFIRPVMWPT
jgi:uncharacterized LabA/DUF88 family protein